MKMPVYYTTVDGTPRGCASYPHASKKACEAVAVKQNAKAKEEGLKTSYVVAEVSVASSLGFEERAVVAAPPQ